MKYSQVVSKEFFFSFSFFFLFLLFSVSLLLEEARVRANPGFKLAPPVLKGPQRHDLDAAGPCSPAKAGKEVEGVLDDALSEDGGGRRRCRGGCRRRCAGFAGGELLQALADGIGGLDGDANHEAAALGIGAGTANLEHGALLAGADAAQEAKVGRRVGLRGGGDVARRREVDRRGGVFGQGDAGQQEDDNVGEGLCRGKGVEERGRGGRRGWVGDERLAGGDDAEERAGHGVIRESREQLE